MALKLAEKRAEGLRRCARFALGVGVPAAIWCGIALASNAAASDPIATPSPLQQEGCASPPGDACTYTSTRGGGYVARGSTWTLVASIPARRGDPRDRNGDGKLTYEYGPRNAPEQGCALWGAGTTVTISAGSRSVIVAGNPAPNEVVGILDPEGDPAHGGRLSPCPGGHLPGIPDGGIRDGDADGGREPVTRSLSLRGPRLSRRRFRAARRGAAVAPRSRRLGRRVGTWVRYRLSRRADVIFRVQRARRRKGRLVGGRCVRRTRRNARLRKCTRYRTLRGAFLHRGEAGLNRFRFTGRIRGRRLRRDRYRLIARACDSAGNLSERRRVRFRIVRR